MYFNFNFNFVADVIAFERDGLSEIVAGVPTAGSEPGMESWFEWRCRKVNHFPEWEFVRLYFGSLNMKF